MSWGERVPVNAELKTLRLEFEDDGEEARKTARGMRRIAEFASKASAGYGHRLVPRGEVRAAVERSRS